MNGSASGSGRNVWMMMMIMMMMREIPLRLSRSSLSKI